MRQRRQVNNILQLLFNSTSIYSPCSRKTHNTGSIAVFLNEHNLQRAWIHFGTYLGSSVSAAPISKQLGACKAFSPQFATTQDDKSSSSNLGDIVLQLPYISSIHIEQQILEDAANRTCKEDGSINLYSV